MTQAFNLSQFANFLNTSGQLSLTSSGITGTLGVANGGSGAASLTANGVLLGNGTSAFQTVTGSASGQVLQWNGTTWTAVSISSGGNFQTLLYTAPGTFNPPSSTTMVRVTVIGGGGGATAPNSGSPGGSSSFGSYVSATGGAGWSSPSPGLPIASPGTGTVSTGTALKVNDIKTSTGGGGGYAHISGFLMGVGAGAGPTGIPAPGIAYSTTGGRMAGGVSTVGVGFGGMAIAMVPITGGTPIPITVGAGGSGGSPYTGSGGTGGVVVVEYVG